MEKKDLVRHQKSGKMYLYLPVVERSRVRKNRLSSLLSEVFAGDPVRLFSTLVETGSLAREDMEEIRRIMEEKAGE